MLGPSSSRWSWRLLRNLHHPLPRTSRETKQLLNTLKKSYERRLERLHPKTSHEPVEAHLHGILSSPHFSGNRQGLIAQGHDESSRLEFSSNQLWEAHRDQIEALLARFQAAVAIGTADGRFATKTLLSIRKVWRIEPRISKVIQASQVSSTFLHWWWSLGGKQNEILDASAFYHAMMPFLVAESQQQHVYEWIRQAVRAKSESLTSYSSELYCNMIRCICRYGKGPQAAVRTVLADAEALPARIDENPEAMAQTLLPVLAHLTSRLPAWLSRGQISVEDYEAFYKLRQTKFPANMLGIAHLSVHHPTDPRPGYALRYLRSLAMENASSMSLNRKTQIINFSLVAASTLLRQGHEAHTKWIMEALKVYFSEELGLEGESSSEGVVVRHNARPEQLINLGLLEGLSLRNLDDTISEIASPRPD